MGKLVRVCPDRVEQIAEIVLRWSKHQQEPRLFTWHAFLESDMQKMIHGLQATNNVIVKFRTVRANAITVLEDEAVACPGKSEEILSRVLQTCEEEDKELQLAAGSQLAMMAQACSDKSKQDVRVALYFCNDERWKTRAMAVFHLSKLAAVDVGSQGEVVSALLRACNDRQSIVRMAASIQPPKSNAGLHRHGLNTLRHAFLPF